MLKWFTTKTTIAVLGVLFVVVTPLSIWALTGGTSNLLGLVRIFADSSFTTPNVATAAGELYVEGDIEADGNLNIAGTSTLTGAITLTGATTQTGDLTCQGGAGALTFSDSASSIVLPDDDTTALDIGSTGLLNLLRFDTGNNTETVIVTGTTAVEAFKVGTGTSTFTEGADLAVPAAALQVIRFCGNGINGATPSYMGPVLLDDTEADLVFGGAGCDALDNTTEGTADAPWHSAFAFNPVAMVCVGLCTAAGGANDAITYQLRDDTADVTGMTCTAAAWTGDGVAKQCVVRDATPATVAANSAIAIKMSGTDDACTDGGDDFECLLYVTF